MAFERIVLSKEGRGDINRIITFLRSLIVKVEHEAEPFETKDISERWVTYKTSIEKSADFYTINYTRDDLLSFGYTNTEIDLNNLTDKMQMQILLRKKNARAQAFINRLQNNYIMNYVERNNYYGQFNGTPLDNSQIIPYPNKDKDSIDNLYRGKDYVPLHIITQKDFPICYEYLFVQREIDKYIEKYPDYLYLRFIQEPLNIYELRNAENFDILYYKKGILSQDELNIFFKVYKETQEYILRINWKEGFSHRYPEYSYLQEYLLFMRVIQSYFNHQLERYTLCNYTDQEIYDILDSYDLSVLKQIDIKILRKIIKNLPELLEIRGSNQVILKLLDYMEDEDITVKRYLLQKRYRVGSDDQIQFDETKLFEDSVSLVFKEEIFKANIDVLLEREKDASTAEVIFDYHNWTEEDPLWGGDGRGLSEDARYNLRENLKKELLTQDFTSIYTKYMTLSTVNDIKEKRESEIQKFNFFIHRAMATNNFLFDDTLLFKGDTYNPIVLYSVMCLFQGILNSVPNPDKIQHNNVFSTFLKMVDPMNIANMEEELKNYLVFIPTKGGNIPIRNILGEDFNYINYIIRHSNTEDELLILKEFNDDKKLLDMIKDRIFEETDFELYSAWKAIYEFNFTKKLFSDLYEESISYFDVIGTFSPSLEISLKTNLHYTGDESSITEEIKRSRIDYVLNEVSEYYQTFNKYIYEKSETNIYLSGLSETETHVAYLNDLMVLFKEFLSVYTTLYKTEFVETLRDNPYNKFKYLYEYVLDYIDDDIVETHKLRFETFSTIFDTGDQDLFFGFKNEIMLDDVFEEFTLFLFNLIKYKQIFSEVIDDWDMKFNISKDLIPTSETIYSDINETFQVKHHYKEDFISVTENMDDFFTIKDVGISIPISEVNDYNTFKSKIISDTIEETFKESFGTKHSLIELED